MDFDDEATHEAEQRGSDELLSDDNLRLPEGASILVRQHALRAWLARRQNEASIEIGEAALALQQIMEGEQQETRLRRRERERFAERLKEAQETLEAAQQRLRAYEEAGELLEGCINHTTTGERVLAEYYLALEELVQESALAEVEEIPRLRALYDVQQRVERVAAPHTED
jgi:hypothetical protein